MTNTRLMKILRSIIISEKSQFAVEKSNCYVFEVLADATKPEIKKAVEICFNVKVKSVNTLNIAGKKRRTAHGYGVRSDWKKAYVTLEADQNIDMTQTDKESN